MQAINLSTVEPFISTARLSSYTAILNGGSTTREALTGMYIWNKLLCSSLYPIFQCLEITLRNALHAAATNHFCTPDWYSPLLKLVGDEKFLSLQAHDPGLASKYYRNGVSTGKRTGKKQWRSHQENILDQAKNRILERQKSPTSDAVIAEMTFGFWVSLFERSYFDHLSSSKLWPHLGPVIFKNLKQRGQIHRNIHHRLISLQKIRNRFSHHEPVWKNSTVTNLASAIHFVTTQIDDALDLIRCISIERLDLLHSTGQIARFYGLCNEDVAQAYRDGKIFNRIDKRRIKHEVNKALKPSYVRPLVIQDRGVPIMFVPIL